MSYKNVTLDLKSHNYAQNTDFLILPKKVHFALFFVFLWHFSDMN